MRVILSSIYARVLKIFFRGSNSSSIDKSAISDLHNARTPHDDWHPHPSAGAGTPVCLCLDWNYAYLWRADWRCCSICWAEALLKVGGRPGSDIRQFGRAICPHLVGNGSDIYEDAGPLNPPPGREDEIGGRRPRCLIVDSTLQWVYRPVQLFVMNKVWALSSAVRAADS